MSQYTAQSLEVLSGLDPVRRRPGMYTDTSRPNHLAQEVIDNAVDEALAGMPIKSRSRCIRMVHYQLKIMAVVCLSIFTQNMVRAGLKLS